MGHNTILLDCNGLVGGVMLDRRWIDRKPVHGHPSILLRMQRVVFGL